MRLTTLFITSFMRYNMLILDKAAMANLNVEYTVNLVYMDGSYGSTFDPTIDGPPDYSLLSPFANNGGY